MKELENLKEQFEELFNIKLESLCEKKSGDYYVPVPKHNKESTKYWLRFFSTTKGEYAVMGDFSNPEAKHTLKVAFSLKNIKTSSKDPSPEEYYKNILKKDKAIKIFLKSQKKSLGKYLKEFKKIKNTTYTDAKEEICFIPYKNFSKQKYCGVLRVYPDGGKYWLKGSEAHGSYHMVKAPEKKGPIYVAEGIRTAYTAAAYGLKNAGVLSIGSISNLEKAVKTLTEKEYTVILCSEKEGYETYINIKNQYSTLIVGSKEFSDIYEYWKKTDENCLRTILRSFAEKTFIPLGIASADRIKIYLKSRGDMVEYKKGESLQLYADCEDLKEVPKLKTAQKFYWKVRHACRIKGQNSGFFVIKEGVFPYGNAFVFFDRKNLYLLKKGRSVHKLNLLDHITRDSIFIRSDFSHFFNYDTLPKLKEKEIKYIFNTLKIFGLDDFENKLIFGWVIQSLICGGLDHRTPIWINGASFSGKSWIATKYLMNCFLYKVKGFGRNTTPRYIVRELNGKASPLYREEMEPNKFKDADTLEEMEYLRETVTDRFPSRGIAKSIDDTVTFTFCFSSLFTSIEIPYGLTSADFSRILFFNLLRKERKDFQKEIKAFEKFMTPRKKAQLLKFALTHLYKIRENYAKLLEDFSSVSVYSHKKPSVLSLVACFNTCMNESIEKKDIIKFLKKQKGLLKKKARSKKLTHILYLILDARHYVLDRSYTLLEVLSKIESDTPEEKTTPLKDLLNSQGFYIIENKNKKLLLIHLQIGTAFCRRLLIENDKKNSLETETINFLLADDGDYLIKSHVEIKKEGVRKGFYHVFDYSLIEKNLLGVDNSKSVPF